ncbi:hypothetical protein BHM03_00036159 [Ensete ventricosum]|nr:hypothetical protein BHM03_00036159 [Ensete ventricosum]
MQAKIAYREVAHAQGLQRSRLLEKGAPMGTMPEGKLLASRAGDTDWRSYTHKGDACRHDTTSRPPMGRSGTRSQIQPPASMMPTQGGAS